MKPLRGEVEGKLFFFRPFRWLWIAFVAMLVLIGTSALLFAIYPFASGSPLISRPYFFWGFWPFFGFGWGFLFLVFLILVGVRWILWPWRGRGYYYWGRRSNYDPALQALRERYAHGEITKDQFDQMMRDLSK